MMIFLLLFGVLLGSQVPSHFMSISQEGVTVSVAADRDDRHQFHIQVNSELGKEDFKVRLDLDVVEGLSIQDSSLAILGGAQTGLVDLALKQVFDAFWGYRPVASEQGCYIAYLLHTPRFPPSGSYPRQMVCIYDRTLSPEANRLSKEKDSPRFVGFPVFPESSASGDHPYELFAWNEDERIEVTSGLAWFDSNTLLFTTWEPGRNWIRIVNLSENLLDSTVRSFPINEELSPLIEGTPPERMSFRIALREDAILFEVLRASSSLKGQTLEFDLDFVTSG